MTTKPPTVTDSDASELRFVLDQRGLDSLQVTKRSPCLRVEAVDEVGAYPILRLRRSTVHLWVLEFPTSGNRWETTPYRDTMPNLLDRVVADFSWVIAIPQNPV
jgi:hypothetical protein